MFGIYTFERFLVSKGLCSHGFSTFAEFLVCICMYHIKDEPGCGKVHKYTNNVSLTVSSSNRNYGETVTSQVSFLCDSTLVYAVVWHIAHSFILRKAFFMLLIMKTLPFFQNSLQIQLFCTIFRKFNYNHSQFYSLHKKFLPWTSFLTWQGQFLLDYLCNQPTLDLSYILPLTMVEEQIFHLKPFHSYIQTCVLWWKHLYIPRTGKIILVPFALPNNNIYGKVN